MLLASTWEAGFGLVRLLLRMARVAFTAMPDWVRYPVLALGAALLVHEVVTHCRTWWRERGNERAVRDDRR